MKQFPLAAPFAGELAELIVGYINMEMRMSPRRVRTFERQEIALALKIDPKMVGEVLMQIDASDNGVTVCIGDIDEAFKSLTPPGTPKLN